MKRKVLMKGDFFCPECKSYMTSGILNKKNQAGITTESIHVLSCHKKECPYRDKTFRIPEMEVEEVTDEHRDSKEQNIDYTK